MRSRSAVFGMSLAIERRVMADRGARPLGRGVLGGGLRRDQRRRVLRISGVGVLAGIGSARRPRCWSRARPDHDGSPGPWEIERDLAAMDQVLAIAGL